MTVVLVEVVTLVVQVVMVVVLMVVVLGRGLDHVAATLVVVVIVGVTLRLQWKHYIALATEHTQCHRGSDGAAHEQCRYTSNRHR